MSEFNDIDWSRHDKGSEHCAACTDGYPHRCGCGGLFHGEVVHVPHDNFRSLVTRCDVCGLPEEG